MIWFTSDWHLDHANILVYANRPFRTVDIQQKKILEKFFHLVQSGDVVYFLGDFAFQKKTVQMFVTQFREHYGHTVDWHFIEGNHDGYIRNEMRSFATSISQLKTITVEGRYITLCHYPMYSFPYSDMNAWQLFGHHHRQTHYDQLGKRMNIGVDVHRYVPVSLNTVKKWMASRPNNWDYKPKTLDIQHKISDSSQREFDGMGCDHV